MAHYFFVLLNNFDKYQVWHWYGFNVVDTYEGS